MKETVIKQKQSARYTCIWQADKQKQEQRGCRASGTDSGEKEKVNETEDE